ncbi:MAG: phosphopentomutase [Proteobacteria bacterium]|nr:phosphopentomutase [Pseudomonadota bacterium]MDA1355282.1 phosphopentomutase [Pseudomonadota bacterium]
MSRAFVLVMDSLGLGGAADAEAFGDSGADTLRHIAEKRALEIPNLMRLGLGAAAQKSSGESLPNVPADGPISGAHGAAQEKSAGKDTPSGHWEMAGVPVWTDWGYFPREIPCFPADLTEALITRAGLPGVIGNCHASGTEIIAELGDAHMASGKPIVYTSADSVFQIAAHEESFGLKRLLEICIIARELVDEYNVGRVIARPFVGSSGSFTRTGNRRDYSLPPPAPTLLDRFTGAGGAVVSIGKIGDIFAHHGTGRIIKANGNAELWQKTLEIAGGSENALLSLTNFVDFDTLFGHRRDIEGYAAALEAFDRALPDFEALLRPGDLAIITADHGCDPSWRGSDHTRENVPVLAFGPGVHPAALGLRESFADIGQTVAGHLGLTPLAHGQSFLTEINAPI